MHTIHGPLSVLTCLLTSLAGPAQQAGSDSSVRDEAKIGCERSAIEWFVPGDFEAARAEAKKQGRMLVIKGISFGVDEAGAKCATKGRW